MFFLGIVFLLLSSVKVTPCLLAHPFSEARSLTSVKFNLSQISYSDLSCMLEPYLSSLPQVPQQNQQHDVQSTVDDTFALGVTEAADLTVRAPQLKEAIDLLALKKLQQTLKRIIVERQVGDEWDTINLKALLALLLSESELSRNRNEDLLLRKIVNSSVAKAARQKREVANRELLQCIIDLLFLPQFIEEIKKQLKENQDSTRDGGDASSCGGSQSIGASQSVFSSTSIGASQSVFSSTSVPVLSQNPAHAHQVLQKEEKALVDVFVASLIKIIESKTSSDNRIAHLEAQLAQVTKQRDQLQAEKQKALAEKEACVVC